MWRTPAPPLTAFVASIIWSGVGEVKTSPGQAASSIPGPTKPPCMGSCPEPPPDTIPTFPSTGASARTTNDGSYDTRKRSPYASSTPSSASRTTASGALINFFIVSSPRHAPAPNDDDPAAVLCLGMVQEHSRDYAIAKRTRMAVPIVSAPQILTHSSFV